MSFDCIGPLTKSIEDSKIILDIISGQDNFDTTTSEPKIKLSEPKSIGLVDVKNFATKEIKDLVETKTKEVVKKNNLKLKLINLPLDIALETYYILVYTEFYSGTRKFDGRRFGKSIDKFGGPEIQRRIIGGSEITKAEFEGRYYREALKAKNYIKKQFEELFKTCDAIILPTVPKLAHKIGEEISPKEMYAYDVFTVLANIAGIPAISIPLGQINNKPIGLQILAPHFREESIFKIGAMF
jgi:aspartyl-tRNA(Asn)/glutamyl-tRNA(Gln) amidotransferase subunit A